MSVPSASPKRLPAQAAVRRLLGLLASGDHLRVCAIVFLRVVERTAVVAVAVTLVARDPFTALFVSAGLSAALAIRGLLRASLAWRARSALVETIVGGLLGGDVLAPLEESETLAAAYESTFAGQQLISDELPGLAADSIAACILTVWVIVEAPARVIAIGGAALLVAAIALVSTRAVVQRATSVAYEAYERIYHALDAAVAGRLELVANGRDAQFRAFVADALAHWRVTAARSDFVAGVAGRVPILAAAAFAGAAVLASETLRTAFVHGALGDAVLVASVAPAFLGVLRGALAALRNTVRLAPLWTILDAPRPPEGGRPGTRLPDMPARVELHAVSFAFPAREDKGRRLALRNVDIDWAPGRILALTGPNGSGKSTFLRLLLGLAKPTSGAIHLGGTDLFDIDLAAFRRTVAYLPQRPYLPERATIREAVALIARDATDASMERALARVGLWESLVVRAPSEPLSVRAGTLSVGQKQRLALARLLCQDARYVLLDEPDSGLDRAGIALVGSLVRELGRDRMVALAAHDPELIAIGDLRVALEALDPK